MTDCTLIIPTHNRHAYLERSINWLVEFRLPIIIADSTKSEWKSELRNHHNLIYLHIPGGFEVYYKKIFEALNLVNSKYVNLCADDDFIFHSGLIAAISFLEENPDYSFAQGYSYMFQRFSNKIITWPTEYYNHNNESNNWIDRLKNANHTIYYGTNRNINLLESFKFLLDQDFRDLKEKSAGLCDLAITLNTAKHGKFKLLEIPFALREYSAAVTGISGREDMVTSEEVSRFYMNLYNLLSNKNIGEGYKEICKIFCKDVLDRMNYDFNRKKSKKRLLSELPEEVVNKIEYTFRLINSTRSYVRFGLSTHQLLTQLNEYQLLKKHIIKYDV